MSEVGGPLPAGTDREQFLRCYRSTVGAVYGYLARASGGDRQLAEDLAQEVYVAALTRVRRGDDTVLTLPWLRATARNKLVDHFRRTEREQRKLRLVASDPVRQGDTGNGFVVERLRSLPPTQRAAVALRYLDDLPVAEVARLLDRSPKATESLLSRAREALRREPLEATDE